jgi:hypothetical protein
MAKEFFYYYRDGANRPLVTVCLMEKEGVLCRGISICSRRDNVCKETGRQVAHDKCLKAFGTGVSGCKIRRERAKRVLTSADCGWMNKANKSDFDVKPWNDFEMKLLREEAKNG